MLNSQISGPDYFSKYILGFARNFLLLLAYNNIRHFFCKIRFEFDFSHWGRSFLWIEAFQKVVTWQPENKKHMKYRSTLHILLTISWETWINMEKTRSTWGTDQHYTAFWLSLRRSSSSEKLHKSASHYVYPNTFCRTNEVSTKKLIDAASSLLFRFSSSAASLLFCLFSLLSR